jgi:hypothetical protein
MQSLTLALTLTAALAAHDPCPELPPLAVARCLPTAEHARAAVDFAAKFLEGYSGGPVVSVVEWNLWYWRTVLDVHNEERSLYSRRHSLGQLVDWLGWEAVLSGRLPPPVPLDLIPVAP